MEHARRHHRRAIEQRCSRHLTDADIEAVTRALEKISAHARPLRPGRIRSSRSAKRPRAPKRVGWSDNPNAGGGRERLGPSAALSMGFVCPA